MSVTEVECDMATEVAVAAEVAVTVIVYVPAGVPPGLLVLPDFVPTQLPASPFVHPAAAAE
jgi:hypothetical protein